MVIVIMGKKGGGRTRKGKHNPQGRRIMQGKKRDLLAASLAPLKSKRGPTCSVVKGKNGKKGGGLTPHG